MTPTVGSLFSGIGGIDLGLERAGFHILWQCENDAYARAVLRHHWPDVPCYPDVRTLGCDVPRVDLLVGGFPCQPVSVAGKGLAQRDPRWLWPAFRDVIGRLRPPLVLIENVPGLRNRGLRDVLADLAALGFDAEWTIIRACDFGAPHIRARLFLVATDADRAELRLESGWFSGAYRHLAAQPDEHGEGWHVADAENRRDQRPHVTTGLLLQPVGGSKALGHTASARSFPAAFPGVHCSEARSRSWDVQFERPNWWRTEPDVGRVAHGVPARVDRLRCLGNGVVPQKAEAIGHLLMQRCFA